MQYLPVCGKIIVIFTVFLFFFFIKSNLTEEHEDIKQSGRISVDLLRYGYDSIAQIKRDNRTREMISK